ncbi:MAG: XdhC family protein [Negativicutes bacterium]|nr:XdhC family protein [Negativicutes bacterium]
MKEFEFLRQAQQRGEQVQTITLIAGPPGQPVELGQMLLVYADGRAEGALVDDEFSRKVLAELQFSQWTKPVAHMIRYQEGEYRVFWNCLGDDRLRAVILGGGHISQPLARIFAVLDFAVTVVDDRLEFANRQRFPEAEKILCQDFSTALAGLNLDERTAVIIVTRGHRHDAVCLRSVLGRQVGYIGMIGSTVKVRATKEALRQEGIDGQLLDGLRAPIGLDIGAEGPAEIAVSIAAEVVAAFRGGDGAPLSLRRRGTDG